MNAHLFLSHVSQDSTASILSGLTPVRGTCWHAAEATTPMRMELDVLVRPSSSLCPGAFSEEVHFRSKITLLSYFPQWELLHAFAAQVVQWFVCTPGCFTAAGSPGYHEWHCFWLLMRFTDFLSGVNKFYLLFYLILPLKSRSFAVLHSISL